MPPPPFFSVYFFPALANLELKRSVNFNQRKDSVCVMLRKKKLPPLSQWLNTKYLFFPKDLSIFERLALSYLHLKKKKS